MPFFVVGQHSCKATFLQNQPAQIIKILESCWPNKLIAESCLLILTPLGLSHIKKGRLWSTAKSTCKCEFHPYAVFSAWAQWKVKSSDKLVLSSINKDQLKDSHNYLNQKMIASINTVVDSALGDHLVIRLYVSSAHSSWSCWKWLRASCHLQQ